MINWDGEPSGYAKKSGKLDFSMKIGYIGNFKWKNLQMTILGYIFIYVQKHYSVDERQMSPRRGLWQFLVEFGSPSAVTAYSVYFRLHRSTMPDLKF